MTKKWKNSVPKLTTTQTLLVSSSTRNILQKLSLFFLFCFLRFKQVLDLFFLDRLLPALRLRPLAATCPTPPSSGCYLPYTSVLWLLGMEKKTLQTLKKIRKEEKKKLEIKQKKKKRPSHVDEEFPAVC